MALFTAPKPKKDDPFETFINGDLNKACPHSNTQKYYEQTGYGGTKYVVYTCRDCGQVVDKFPTS